MNKIEFLASVANADKTQGNYADTLQPDVWAERENRIWGFDERFIAVYEHLLDRGFKVFVCEVLRKNKKWRKYKFIKGFAHLWLPEINLAIRYNHLNSFEDNRKLKDFLCGAKRFVYAGVISKDTADPIAYVDDLIERVFEYHKTPTKRGIKSVLIKPKPKKKRARIVGAQRV